MWLLILDDNKMQGLTTNLFGKIKDPKGIQN